MDMKAVQVSDVVVVPISMNKENNDNVIVEHQGWIPVSKEKDKRFVVGGHRGSGMNSMQSNDGRMRGIKENTILSFNTAASQPNLHFVEFDVQVTKDDCPVIFHDCFLYTQDHLQGTTNIVEKRVTDLTLDEFLSYGPQRDPTKKGKPLFRKTKDGRMFEWRVEKDHPLCTLEQVFKQFSHHSVGFDIELKLDDNISYNKQQLEHNIRVILNIVNNYSNKGDNYKHIWPVFFSCFNPDAVHLLRKIQDTYPVFFLTKGGAEIHADPRRNSLDQALKLCQSCGLQGVVSESKAIFKNPGMVSKIKNCNLFLLTYGQLNNVPEAVYMQYLMGVDGVVVDLVPEILEAVSTFMPVEMEEEDEEEEEEEQEMTVKELKRNGESMDKRPRFTTRELSFLLRLIPELVHHT